MIDRKIKKSEKSQMIALEYINIYGIYVCIPEFFYMIGFGCQKSLHPFDTRIMTLPDKTQMKFRYGGEKDLIRILRL